MPTLNLNNIASSTVNIAVATGDNSGADYFVDRIAATIGTITPRYRRYCFRFGVRSTDMLSAPNAKATYWRVHSGSRYPVKLVLPDGGVFSYTAIDGHAG